MITDEEIEEIERELFSKEVREAMEQFELDGYEPELVTDEVDFKPLNGRYVCRITDIGKREGISTKTNEPYSFYYIKLQVIETIDGDKGTNRYLDKNYGDKLDDKREVVKTALKLMADDLFTAGLPFATTSEDDFFNSLQALHDKTVNLRAWEWNREKQGKINLQMVKIVKEFKVKKEKETKVPF